MRSPKNLMRLFSHRQGIKPYRKEIQQTSVDNELRNRLWTLLNIFVWDRWNAKYQDAQAREIEHLLDELWFRYFKKPVDERPPMSLDQYGRKRDCYDVLKSYFFKCDWNEVYDFIEFIVASISEGPIDIDDLPKAVEEPRGFMERLGF